VPYIGKSDAKGTPVPLARVTRHASHNCVDKVLAYTLPDPLMLANGKKVGTVEKWVKERCLRGTKWPPTSPGLDGQVEGAPNWIGPKRSPQIERTAVDWN
jgi:hypothetical protein